MGDEGVDVRGECRAARAEELAVEEAEPVVQPREHLLGRAAGEQLEREEARRGEIVQDAVAVDVERAAPVRLEEQDLPARVGGRADQVHPQEGRDRVGELALVAQQRGGELHVHDPEQVDELLHAQRQLFAKQAAAPLAEQRARGDARGVGHDREVHLLHDLEAQQLDECAARRARLLAVARELCAPIADRRGERERRAEVHVDRAEAALEEAPRAHQAEHALVFLGGALEFAHHCALFHEPLVGERDRHEQQVAPAAGEERLDVPREHAEPRRQRLAGARAAALDEELLREALLDQMGDVGAEHLLVERVRERPAQEERARAAPQKSERPERHVLARGDVRRQHVAAVEDRRDDQEVEVGAVSGHEHHRVAPRDLGDPLEPGVLDLHEQPRDHRADHEVEDRQEGRAHVRGDLAEHLLRLHACDLFRHPVLGRVLLDRRRHGARPHHDLLHAVARLQDRPLDHALGPVQEGEDRSADHARDLGRARVRARRREPGHVDRVAHLHVQAAVGGEERQHLRDVVGPRERAVGEVQEAPPRARALAPEQRERHHEHRTPRALRGADHLGQQVALLAPLIDAALPAAELRAEARRAQEQEQRAALARQLAGVLARAHELDVLRHAARLARHRVQRVAQRPVVPEADAVGEARQAQSFAAEQRVEQEVVEPARIAHHVHDRALLFEVAQPCDGCVVEVEVAEVARREPAEEQVEARRHRAERIGAQPPLSSARGRDTRGAHRVRLRATPRRSRTGRLLRHIRRMAPRLCRVDLCSAAWGPGRSSGEWLAR